RISSSGRSARDLLVTARPALGSGALAGGGGPHPSGDEITLMNEPRGAGAHLTYGSRAASWRRAAWRAAGRRPAEAAGAGRKRQDRRERRTRQRCEGFWTSVLSVSA